jgi:hypothetical protein
MSTLRVNTITDLAGSPYSVGFAAGAANQILYKNSTNTAVVGSDNLTFDGNNLRISQDSYIKLGDAYVSSGNITSGPNANSRFAHFGSNIYYNGSNWVSDGRGPGGVYQMFTTPAGVVSHNWYKHDGTTGTGTGFTNLMSLGNDGILTAQYGAQIGTAANYVSPGGILNVYNAGTTYSFRGGFIDAVNVNNTDWADFNVRGANVYLRTPDGTARLGVSGDGRAQTFNGGGSMADGIIITSPDATVGNLRWDFGGGYVEAVVPGSAIGWNVFFSDEKLKQNILPSVFNSSELINKIKFIEFDWKPVTGRTGHVDAGVSAQNLQSIDERLVNVLSDDSLMVNEPALVVHIAKALQEALSEIETLKTRISALESK